MAEQNVLLIFVKNLEIGKVKTRLAESIGDEKALEVYKKLVAHTRRVSSEVSAVRQVWYSGFIPAKDDWEGDTFIPKNQKGEDLGERLKHAFTETFRSGYSRAVVIGSDCAELTADHIEQAFMALDEDDLVIGPSEDGGYYLLGMREMHAALFEDISWSTPRVFDQTRNTAREMGLSVTLLAELNDIDHADDWRPVKDQL